MSEISLIVIAKEPIPGRVKTRLCPPCTPAQAATLARSALLDTIEAVAATPAHRRVVALDGDRDGFLPAGFEVVPQVGGGLANRLAGAFRAVGGPALLVGMDTPQLRPQLLAQSAAKLARPATDAVLGLSEDGGYWAIGLRRPSAEVFREISMSSPDTGRAQAERLDCLGLRWSALPVLRDVDTIDDAMAVAADHPRTRFARALSELELEAPRRPETSRSGPVANSGGSSR